jgi:hypothetical protein
MLHLLYYRIFRIMNYLYSMRLSAELAALYPVKIICRVLRVSEIQSQTVFRSPVVCRLSAEMRSLNESFLGGTVAAALLGMHRDFLVVFLRRKNGIRYCLLEMVSARGNEGIFLFRWGSHITINPTAVGTTMLGRCMGSGCEPMDHVEQAVPPSLNGAEPTQGLPKPKRSKPLISEQAGTAPYVQTMITGNHGGHRSQRAFLGCLQWRPPGRPDPWTRQLFAIQLPW